MSSSIKKVSFPRGHLGMVHRLARMFCSKLSSPVEGAQILQLQFTLYAFLAISVIEAT